MKLSTAGETTTAAVWLGLAAVLALVHFAASEITYRLAGWLQADSLDEVSHTISWPAGVIYDQVETAIIIKALQTAAVGGGNQAEEARKFLNQFEQKDAPHPMESDDLWNWLGLHAPEATVSTGVEYLIYGGTSVAWGLVLGLFGYALTRGVIAALPEPSGKAS